MPMPTLCKPAAGIALALLSLSSARADELDVFGRPFSENNMIPAKSNVCTTRDALDVRPVLLRGVQPLYPIDSMLSRQAGSALIRYRIGEDGKTTVLSAETKGESDKRKWFGNHAVIAVGSWTFAPGQRAGVPVAVSCAIEFVFGF